ncbi:drug/metabolite transporter (DMT) family transporter [Skeletonema marinoi]|uniref:Drug/metabolite transporter (DMT) family transporter n=1 Tax=Skeletonema marinoi TaxID=267567 RepID=A0AAD9D860_9STRA|nr:drug/metabolite transporter (DMT) family transporter [Skeletonema marinoi]
MKNNYFVQAAWPVIFALASLSTPIRATLQTFNITNIVKEEDHYSTFLQGDKQQQLKQQRKQTFLSVDREAMRKMTQLKSHHHPYFENLFNCANITSSKTAKGRAILLFVAFLYGTLNVTLRAVYASDGAPTASVLSLVRQCLSVLTFIPIIASANIRNNAAGNETEREKIWVLNNSRPLWLAAAELAFWNCGAQGLINAGLLFSPAARASFLTQTSVVLTPLISAVAGETIQSSVWGGCALALVGLFLISTSSSDTSSVTDTDILATASSFNQGDAMILLGALSWSAYIFRTSQIANKYSELDLQFTKTAFLAGMYGIWFLFEALSTLKSGGTLLQLWSGFQSIPVWIILAYSAVGPGAIADLLQQQGQKEVTASESNIILCMESIFAAVCAFTLLGEVSSIKEVIGGLFIVVAAILASKQ